MTDLLPIARFPLPDDWSVESTTCVVFRVPDDPQYVSQIIGLVDMLKWSRNFALDDTRSGAASVSRTWQAALESMPVEVGCNMFLLRQNPSNLCQLQQSLDGGETWTLAFDYSLCGIKTPPPTGTIDRAASFIRGFHEPLIERVIDLCGGDRDDAIASLTDWIRTYDPGYANPTALGQLFDEVCALSPEEKAELTEDCAYLEQYQSLSECDDIEAWYDWLDCIAEKLGSTLDSWATAIGNALNNAAAALGLGGIGAFTNGGAAGGGGGFGAECGNYWVWHYEGADDHPVDLLHGTVGAGGNPGDCVIGEFFLTGLYYRLCQQKIEVISSMTLKSVIADCYGEWTGGGNIPLDVYVYDDLDVEQHFQRFPGAGTQSTWDQTGGDISPNIAMSAGWYIVVNWGSSWATAPIPSAAVMKMDNLRILFE